MRINREKLLLGTKKRGHTQQNIVKLSGELMKVLNLFKNLGKGFSEAKGPLEDVRLPEVETLNCMEMKRLIRRPIKLKFGM